MRKAILSGAETIAEGAIRAGVNFYAGYPITPASPIYRAMIQRLPAQGGIAIGASDEISALSYCIGAALRGLTPMTATAAPGFSLMIESLSYAIMTELPVLVVLAQRLGPATGAATQSAQGDILLSEFFSSGAFPVPVFSPSTPTDAYALTAKAVAVAETLRTPVILLTEKEVTMTYETVDLDRFPEVEQHYRPQFRGNGRYRSYAFEHLEEIPSFSPVGGPFQVRATGSAHNKDGLLMKDDPEVIEVLRHLAAKIAHRAEELAEYRLDGDPQAPVAVLAFGVTARAAREALYRLGKGLKVITLYSLFPVPRRTLERLLANVELLIVPEENLSGQYRLILQALFPHLTIRGVNKIGGLITPEEILDALPAPLLRRS